MSGDELREIDRDLVALKVSNAQLAVTVSALAKQVGDLQEVVAELTATMNRGRGALWGIMLIAGALGASVTTIAKKLLGVT